MKAGSYKPGGYRRRGAAPHICTTGPVWTQRASSPLANWNALTFGNGILVAGGGSTAFGAPAVVETSVDFGATWVAGPSPPVFVGGSSIKASCLAFGNGVFVAFGDFVSGAASADGVTWSTFAVSGHGTDFLYFGGTVFVLISQNDNILRISTNGTVWLNRNLPGFPAVDTWAVGTYEPVSDTHVVLASANTARSVDGGVTWTAGGITPFGFIGPLAAAGGGGIVVATSATTNQKVVYTTDGGLTWQFSALLPVNTIWETILYAQGAFLAASVDGHTAASVDGNIWIAGPSLPAPISSLIWAIAYAGTGHYAGVALIFGGTDVAASGIC